MVKNKNWGNYDICAFAAAFLFLAVSLFNINKYSLCTDGPAIVERGQISLAYFGSLVGLRAPLSLGKVELLKTQFHPSLFPMLNVPFSRVVFLIFKLDAVASSHLLGLLWSTVGLIFLHLLVRRIFGSIVGLFSVLFLIFSPRFIAHAHFNPKDIPTMVWGIIGIYLIHRAFEQKTFVNAFRAGVSMGFAISTGLNGLFLIPVFLLGCIVDFYISAEESRSALGRFMLTVLATMVFSMWLTWPVLWMDPLFVIRSIQHFAGSGWWENLSVLYFGRRYLSIDLPWHYTIVSLILCMPVPVLFLAFAGMLVSLKSRLRENLLTHVLLLAWLFLPILAQSFPGTVRYHGMRHVFFSVPPLMIYAAWGLCFLSSQFKLWWPGGRRWVAGLFVVGLFLHLVIDVFRWHPFEGSYYNEGVRFFIPNHIEKDFEIVPWGVACRGQVDWLNKNAKPNSKICMECLGDPTVYTFRSDLKFYLSKPDDVDADYISVASEALGWPDFESFSSKKPLYIEKRFNSDLFLVFGRE